MCYVGMPSLKHGISCGFQGQACTNPKQTQQTATGNKSATQQWHFSGEWIMHPKTGHNPALAAGE